MALCFFTFFLTRIKIPPGVSELTRRGCVTLAGMRFPALTPYLVYPTISSMHPLLRAGRKFAIGTLVCQGLRCGNNGHGEGRLTFSFGEHTARKPINVVSLM